MRKIFAVMGILVVASMVLAACGAPAAPQTIVQTVIVDGTPQVQVVEVTPVPEMEEKPAVLRINLGSYPDIVDPQKSSFVNEIAHLKLFYEGLTKFNADLETVPGAAEKWVYNDDATQLTFTIRKDLKYSDGTLLNAARFAYAIKRNINPETAGEYAAITDEVLGAPEWRAGDAAAEAIVDESLKASHADGSECTGYDDAACDTFTMTLSKPAPYFHTIMGIWVAFPAKEENITEGGENWWNSSKYQVGNGPYVLKSLEPFVRAYFTPNANYWGEIGKADIEYSYIVDSAVAFEAYKNNEFDMIGAAAEDMAIIKADPQLSTELLEYAGSCTFAVMLHQEKEPFTDPKVREAFTMAFDRESWVRDVLKGVGAPTLTWIPNGYPGYKEGETRWAYDPDKAKAALAASTYGSVENLPEIVLTFSDSPRNRTRYEWLAAKWKEVLGVDAKLNPVEPTTYTALTKDVKTAPAAFVLGWCADYPDPQNWLSVYWKTGGFGERIAYSNADFDALVNQADIELDPATRADLYQQAQDVLLDSIPGAFVWNSVNSYLVKPWVKGIVTTPQDSGWAGDINPSGITIDTTMIP
ncbi:MAG: peptide ABC transporter substrate-binding protein [Anaerolineales bacterium]|jgi:oligopeptide transport system substrate-binding protein|nr:peptide ABC transporter substrate-binding protein [Anaerolineales bacterium]